MADATSTVRVNIIGDARKLSGALKEADKGLAGFGKTLLVGAAAGISIKGAFDFAGDAVQEADRLGDATQRLELQLGKVDAKKIEDVAGNFLKLGLSSQDVLELSAAFADIGTAAGIADPVLAKFAPDVAATAKAIELLGGADAATTVEQIGKAAGGATKPLKDLGVNLDEADVAALALEQSGKKTAAALTEGELATARLTLIMAQLKPKLDAATTGTGDLEQKQAELQARTEELQGKLGGPLSDALATVVGFINDEIDALPHAIDGFRQLGDAVNDFAHDIAAPLARARDAIEGVLNLAGSLGGALNVGGAGSAGSHAQGRRGTTFGSNISERGTVQAVRNNTLRNRVGGP